MALKIVAIAMLVIAGLALAGSHATATAANTIPSSLTDFGGAMVPVLFAYGGWQTSTFIAAEIREPEKNLPRALVVGVLGVVILYTTVNWVCVRALGPEGLAATRTPATAVMQLALGRSGVIFIAAAIAISTLGFLSQSILTAPRVYFAMAEDGLFFRAVAWLDPRTRVPVLAIVLQSIWTVIIVLSGRYEQIVNYVVSIDFLFFGLTAATIFVFRHRAAQQGRSIAYRTPGHPATTLIFIAISWWVVGNTVYRYPQNSLIGFGLLLAGIPVYWFWSRSRSRRNPPGERKA